MAATAVQEVPIPAGDFPLPTATSSNYSRSLSLDVGDSTNKLSLDVDAVDTNTQQQQQQPAAAISPFAQDATQPPTTNTNTASVDIEPDSPQSKDPPASHSNEDEETSSPPQPSSDDDNNIDSSTTATRANSKQLVPILSTAMTTEARMNKMRRNVSWTDLATNGSVSLVEVQEYHPEKPPSPKSWDDLQQEPVMQGCQCTVM